MDVKKVALLIGALVIAVITAVMANEIRPSSTLNRGTSNRFAKLKKFVPSNEKTTISASNRPTSASS